MAVLAVALTVVAPAWAGANAAAAKPGQAQQKAKGFGAVPAGTVSAGTGIVQAVAARAVVVRELDGSIVRVLVGPKTRVFVNGVRSSLANVRPGFVVQFAGTGSVARVLRAQGSSPKPKAGAAAVVSVSSDAVVVSIAGGGTVSIPVDARTRVFVDAAPATLADVRMGDLVVSGGPAKRPVPVLRLRRPS